ncbi:ATP-binding protein [Nocardioides zeae]
MPQSREAVRLEPGPTCVQQARRWAAAVCRDMEREDLLDAAELGVSELVTNALLHATEPVTVRVRGTRAHPASRSPTAPASRRASRPPSPSRARTTTSSASC